MRDTPSTRTQKYATFNKVKLLISTYMLLECVKRVFPELDQFVLLFPAKSHLFAFYQVLLTSLNDDKAKYLSVFVPEF